MNVLVTGGAGYVGSIVTEDLVNNGYEVVVLDNLQEGHEKAVADGARFIKGDICNTTFLDGVFSAYKFEAVMHMAAETLVDYSLTSPEKYFYTNNVGGLVLLETMRKYRVPNLIFSSTAAVYGEPQVTPIEETHPLNPINSYGESKLIFEKMLASERLGEFHIPETHLIPVLIKAAMNCQSFQMFGDDYPTRDGSCIRDYVHVVDIAQAHRLALENIDSHAGQLYNLGNGDGFSVFEVAEAVEKITGKTIRTDISPRRAGDPAILLASSEKAKTELGWKPSYLNLEDIIESAFRWHNKHPNGYKQVVTR